MKRISTFFLALLIPFAPVHAQHNDTKAILDAIGKLDSRLNEMQSEIDTLKRDSQTPSQQKKAMTAKALDSTNGMPEGMRPSAGWLVDVLPIDYSKREPDSLFRFRQPTFPLTFRSHLATKHVDDYVKFKGEAFLNVTDPGRYVFSYEVRARSKSACAGYLRIGSTVVLDIGDETSPRSRFLQLNEQGSATASGGTDLGRGTWEITFLLACWDYYGGLRNQPEVGVSHGSKKRWRDIEVDLQVRGPNDDVPRPFGPKEIFHWVKAR